MDFVVVNDLMSGSFGDIGGIVDYHLLQLSFHNSTRKYFDI